MSSPVEQPPVSGPGSGVAAWRDYAAAVTGEPVAEFDDMSRDDIVEYLESVGEVEPEQGPAESTEGPAAPEQATPIRRGPQWIRPDGSTEV